MNNFHHSADILIVGAGMAGLTAASDLQLAGKNVLIVDKGRSAGGRMASRRIGQATFDHGAQFFTARDPRFAAAVDQWLKMGAAEEWYRNPPNTPEQSEGHPRWRGKPSMTAIAKKFALDLNVLLEKRIVSLRHETAGWVAALDDGEEIFANAVVLTPPVPQSLALLDAGAVSLPSVTRARLESIEYERCLTVMAVLNGPSRIPPPGGMTLAGSPIQWLADNQMKGISAIPAITIHAAAGFSLEKWDLDREETGRELLKAAEPWLGSEVITFQVHGWRYSKPISIDESPCLILNHFPPLVIAGDAFAGARVEGAAISGWAAAEHLK
jgi:renalase